MPRLGHQKSRKGCLLCKRRRVKCDEGKPCSACARHELNCVYENSAPSRKKSKKNYGIRLDFRMDQAVEITPGDTTSSSSISSRLGAHNPNSPATATLSPDPFPYFEKFVNGPKPIEPASWLTDLEFMHQYTSSTYLTLPRAAELQHIWQIQVPRLALSNVFILHQILAVAAHHRSHLYSNRYGYYAMCASMHQNKAITGFRAALAQVSQETCHGIFVTSSLLSICAFASMSYHGGVSEQPRLNDLVDVFQLIRGMSQVLDSFTAFLTQGPLSKLFFQEGNSTPAPLLHSVIERLRDLEIPEMSDDDSVLIYRQTVIDGITFIQKAIRNTSSSDLRASLTFPICLTEPFLDLLRRHEPAALTIIAHYCVILHHAGTDNWYLQGWGRSIALDISRVIDARWRESLAWPLAMIESTVG